MMSCGFSKITKAPNKATSAQFQSHLSTMPPRSTVSEDYMHVTHTYSMCEHIYSVCAHILYVCTHILYVCIHILYVCTHILYVCTQYSMCALVMYPQCITLICTICVMLHSKWVNFSIKIDNFSFLRMLGE